MWLIQGVKMFITFTLPQVFTKERLYTFSNPRDVVRVYVGYISDNNNNENAWDTRNYFLRDKRGNTILKGEVGVKLNTFEGFIDLYGLTVGEVYTLVIENPGTISTTTVISGIDPNTITVVDETFRFTGNPIPFGDIISTLIDPNGSPTSARQAHLTMDWAIARTEGNGLIFSGGKVYAYAPSAIYTRNRQAPTYVDFTPFAGIPVKRIQVYQLPTIANQGNYKYSIDPPTHVIATWENIDGTMQTYDSINAIPLLDLSLITSADIHTIKIRATFP